MIEAKGSGVQGLYVDMEKTAASWHDLMFAWCHKLHDAVVGTTFFSSPWGNSKQGVPSPNPNLRLIQGVDLARLCHLQRLLGSHPQQVSRVRGTLQKWAARVRVRLVLIHDAHEMQ